MLTFIHNHIPIAYLFIYFGLHFFSSSSYLNQVNIIQLIQGIPWASQVSQVIKNIICLLMIRMMKMGKDDEANVKV